MAKTKVELFSYDQFDEINTFLSASGIKYVDLKVLQGGEFGTELLLIYEEDKPGPQYAVGPKLDL
ncbi:MAG: hypothetical protein J4F28_08985 [Nitrosopumilaceae archaeon]|nr:hypothetical protein [Nitrosopumilaceae archaeon]